MRIGHGYDVHAFGDGDHIMLCGVRIAHQNGLMAHSDGDVALHALTDALLGALALGDIGHHFPDDDPYQESDEIYYNMVDFLDDSEVHQIWEIVGKALDRNNIVTTDNESLSVRVYDELSEED